MKHTDLTYLHEVSNGNSSFVKEMVDLFLHQAPDLVKNMSTAIEEGKWKELALDAHKLKSSLKMMGAYSLEEALITIETNAKNEVEPETTNEHIKKVMVTTAEVIEELKNN